MDLSRLFAVPPVRVRAGRRVETRAQFVRSENGVNREKGVNVTENAVSSGNYARKAFEFSAKIPTSERKANLHRGGVGGAFLGY
jgi:hypothetical protein